MWCVAKDYKIKEKNTMKKAICIIAAVIAAAVFFAARRTRPCGRRECRR